MVTAPAFRPADRPTDEVPPATAYRTGEPVWVWQAGRWTTGLVLAVGPASGLVLAACCRGDGKLTERTYAPAQLAPRELTDTAGGAR